MRVFRKHFRNLFNLCTNTINLLYRINLNHLTTLKMEYTGTTHRPSNKCFELRLFDNEKQYISSVYARKISHIYQYCKENNVKITVKNHH